MPAIASQSTEAMPAEGFGKALGSDAIDGVPPPREVSDGQMKAKRPRSGVTLFTMGSSDSDSDSSAGSSSSSEDSEERRKREKPYAWSPEAIQRQRTLGGTVFPSMGRDTAERRAAAEGRFVSSLFNIDNTRVAKVRADSASDLPTFRKKPLEELSISDVNVQDELRQADKEVTPDLVPGDEDEDGGFEE